jgi:hypothetical protein
MVAVDDHAFLALDEGEAAAQFEDEGFDLPVQLADAPSFLRGLLDVMQPGLCRLEWQQGNHLTPAQLA